MSDTTITIIVAGAIQIAGMIVGFLTLRARLLYAGEKAEEAATKAKVVEGKLDANTATTNLVDTKADTIVSQTNGSMEKLRGLVETIAERVVKLEDYNRDTTHRVLDSLNAVHLKVAEMVALQPKPVVVQPAPVVASSATQG